jgi:hypothetical protein
LESGYPGFQGFSGFFDHPDHSPDPNPGGVLHTSPGQRPGDDDGPTEMGPPIIGDGSGGDRRLPSTGFVAEYNPQQKPNPCRPYLATFLKAHFLRLPNSIRSFHPNYPKLNAPFSLDRKNHFCYLNGKKTCGSRNNWPL